MRHLLGLLVLNGRVTLDGLMFDHLLFSLFVVMVICVRSKASVRPHIFHDIVMHEVVKEDIFEFIVLGRRKNWVVQ